MYQDWRRRYFRYKDFFLNIHQLYKKRQDVKMFLEFALTLATTGIFLVFALKPTVITILDLVKEIKAKEETLAKMDTKIKNLKKAQSIIIQEDSKISILKSAIPDNPDPVGMSRQIEGAAYTNAVNIVGISVAETTLVGEEKAATDKKDSMTLPGGASPLTFSAGFSGGFDSLISLISNIESTRRPIKIDSLILTKPKSKDADQNILGLAVTGRAPYLLNTK
jgi:hypothetical protein